MASFKDGLKDVFSGLINKRNGTSRNVVTNRRLGEEELRTMYKTGLMSKIIRLKVGYSLNDTMQFESTDYKEFYDKRLAKQVKKASKYMLGFGRGVIIVFSKGDDLRTPLKPSGTKALETRVFSGDMVTANSPTYDLTSPRYYKPKYYMINGQTVHWSRVVDFSYYEPAERDKAEYNFGGLSESELIYDQFVNDGIVQRAAGSIIDKASTFVYKIKGYKDMLLKKQEKAVVEYVSTCEDGRSIYGGLITDADDMVEVLSQSLTDLDKVDNITLRRLAMVTGLGMTALIGEQASGLNASGDSERQGFQDTIENMQSDYLEEPINYLATLFGLGQITFKDNQGQTPTDRVDYEKKAVEVAKIMWEIGEDYATYLKGKDIIEQDDWSSFWGEADKRETNGDVLSQFLSEEVAPLEKEDV